MSGALCEIVWRNLTVLALVNRTWANGNVQSSLLVPFNELGEKEVAPAVAVFTDAMRAEDSQIDGNDILGAQVVVTLALEIGCVGKVLSQDREGVDTWLPSSDEGIEMTIDVIRQQAIMELQSGDSIWAKLWRDCRVKTVAMSVERGSAIQKGVREAFKRFEMRCQLVGDPMPGQPLTKFWRECLDAFDADDRVSKIAKTLRELATGTQMPEWRSWQAELGLTDDGIRGIGVAPFEGAEADDGDAALSVEITAGDDPEVTEISVGAGGATITIGAGEPVDIVEVPPGG